MFAECIQAAWTFKNFKIQSMPSRSAGVSRPPQAPSPLRPSRQAPSAAGRAGRPRGGKESEQAARTPRRWGGTAGGARRAVVGLPRWLRAGAEVRNRKEARTPTRATLHRKTEERAREGAAQGGAPPARGRRLLVRGPRAQPAPRRPARPSQPPRASAALTA